MRVLLLILFFPLLACNNASEKVFNIGQKSFEFIDEERNRPLKVEVWYPTNDSFQQTGQKKTKEDIFKVLETVPNAQFVDQKFPLLMVSHGTGGNRFSLTWLIERMVKEGYIIVSVGHYGNTTSHKLPREFVKWWERAIDIQFVLDNILANDELNQYIDQTKIGGVGFSLGGYTNIALAGGLVDRTYHEGDKENKKRELPPEFPQTDEVIDFEHDSLILSSYQKYANEVKDERISAFFVMAPAIGFGFHSTSQVADISAPIYIVAGKGDTNTPVEHNAKNYHKLIKTSELHLLGDSVDHYVFLNEATDLGKKVAPQICVDRVGVNRKEIHDNVAELALSFFENHFSLAKR